MEDIPLHVDWEGWKVGKEGPPVLVGTWAVTGAGTWKGVVQLMLENICVHVQITFLNTGSYRQSAPRVPLASKEESQGPCSCRVSVLCYEPKAKYSVQPKEAGNGGSGVVCLFVFQPFLVINHICPMIFQPWRYWFSYYWKMVRNASWYLTWSNPPGIFQCSLLGLEQEGEANI